MIDRILWGKLGRKAVSRAGTTPAYYGWSPARGEYKRLLRHLGSGEIVALDKEAWDWNVREWLIQELYHCLTSIVVDETDWWKKLVLMRWICLFNKASFKLKDGDIFNQNWWGIMKSGCYLTLLANTLMQWLLDASACRKLSISIRFSAFVGDDSVQSKIEQLSDYIDQLEKWGIRCKTPVLTVGHCEFVGMRMTPEAIYPAYEEKHEFLVRHVDPKVSDETLTSYALLYAHDAVRYGRLAKLITDNGLKLLRSREWCSRVLDVPEE